MPKILTLSLDNFRSVAFRYPILLWRNYLRLAKSLEHRRRLPLRAVTRRSDEPECDGFVPQAVTVGGIGDSDQGLGPFTE